MYYSDTSCLIPPQWLIHSLNNNSCANCACNCNKSPSNSNPFCPHKNRAPLNLQSETISIVSVESDVALYVLKGYSGHHLPTRSIYKSSPRWRPRRIFSGSSSWAWRCMRPHWVSEILHWMRVRMTLEGSERCNKTTAIDCRNICENKCENYQSSLRSGFLNVIPWVVAELHLSRTSSVKSILSTPLPGGW